MPNPKAPISGERYRIAELHLSVDTAVDTAFAPAARAFAPYAQPRRRSGRPADITVSAYAGQLPSLTDATLVAEGAGFWSAYRSRGRALFTCQGKDEHAGIWRVISGDADASHFDVITLPAPAFLSPGSALPHPLAFPAAELMLLSHIATRGAAIMHACGVRDHGNCGAGYLFCGRSGAGKSTTARLWHGQGAVLNDDRVLVAHRGHSAFEIHGTPWHGDVRVTDPGRAPLQAIFFLEHAPEHWLAPLTPRQALPRLLTSVWLPLWDARDGVPQTLSLCAQLVSHVPCFRLGFRRDDEVIGRVRDAVSGLGQSLAVSA